jgi:hypothetical protein
MLQIKNRLPLTAGLALFTDSDGRDVASVAVKGTFCIPSGGAPVSLSTTQVPLRHADGPPAESDGLSQYPADLVMGKVASDVGLEGSAYCAESRSVEGVAVSVSVGPLAKEEVVQSDRYTVRFPVRCFLFASAADEQRRRYAGTYDAHWQKKHCPLPPKDFDLRFFNAAAPELVATGYLRGGERVRLVNLSPQRVCEFSLPALTVWLRFRHAGGGTTRRADLWNLVFEPDNERFSLSWGFAFAIGKRPAWLREVEIRVTGEIEALETAPPDIQLSKVDT